MTIIMYANVTKSIKVIFASLIKYILYNCNFLGLFSSVYNSTVNKIFFEEDMNLFYGIHSRRLKFKP